MDRLLCPDTMLLRVGSYSMAEFPQAISLICGLAEAMFDSVVGSISLPWSTLSWEKGESHA